MLHVETQCPDYVRLTTLRFSWLLCTLSEVLGLRKDQGAKSPAVKRWPDKAGFKGC